MCADSKNGGDERPRVMCPVCGKTAGFIEMKGSGRYSQKCVRCGKVILVDLTDGSAVKMRTSSVFYHLTASCGVPSNGLRVLSRRKKYLF